MQKVNKFYEMKKQMKVEMKEEFSQTKQVPKTVKPNRCQKGTPTPPLVQKKVGTLTRDMIIAWLMNTRQ